MPSTTSASSATSPAPHDSTAASTAGSTPPPHPDTKPAGIDPDAPAILTLRNAHDVIRVAPAIGGRLLDWRSDGHAVLRWPTEVDWRMPAKIRGGNPLLFPFIGRHFVDGEANRWRDATGTVRPMPQHGFARDLPFEARQLGGQSDDASGVVLTLDSRRVDQAAAYPFDFVFEVEYELLGAGRLRTTLTVENRGDTPMPYYAGTHFYFDLPHALRSESRLALADASQHRQQADGGPGAALSHRTAFALDDPLLQDTFHVLASPTPDRAGDRLLASLDTPSLGRTIRIVQPPSNAAWYAVTTWSEAPDADFYCIEPWLGLPDAIHHGQGLRWLQPHSREAAICVIEARFAR
ncbi:Galactose mutarotase [Chitinasiproducens palmae]|uniref:Galactose mutarotase n=2 Tax=Chitinasiproducens palmae TaxID=1770053 RepID=A0A1H2PVY7_9BURK|nr:Galactose mutarotase [Chitinasiproducens palmae]